MQAELITIGDEILIGQIVDTNSAWIAEKLHNIGIKVCQIRSISDTKEAIVNALDTSNSDLLIITGGLGPTNDDLTKKVLADYFNTPLELNEEVLRWVKTLLVGRGVVVNDLNVEQAMLPRGAKILENKNGTAAGMWFKQKNKNVISLPGVPYEMKGIMEAEVLPILSENQDRVIVHKTIMTVGLPESMLAMKIKEWEENLPEFIKLAYLPRPGIVRLRLTASGNNKALIEENIEKAIKGLLKIIPDEVYGFDEMPLEKAVADILLEKKATVSTAESCTGGQISALLTSISGSSDYFQGTVVSYSNAIKNGELNVPMSIIEEKGAVSQEVVRFMAESVKKKMGTDYSIAVSGIAGPTGGTEEKPVGTTWIAVSGPKDTVTKLFNFGEHRGRNVTRASLSALNLLRLYIKQ
jgi:nicotinamide-nucleotide amidase